MTADEYLAERMLTRFEPPLRGWVEFETMQHEIKAAFVAGQIAGIEESTERIADSHAIPNERTNSGSTHPGTNP